MRMQGVRGWVGCLSLVSALGVASEAAAQTYFYTFSGAPGSIACANTTASITPGLVSNWNLPAGTQARFTVSVGSTVVQQSIESLSASGSEGFSGSSNPFPAAVPFPYTVVLSMTPLVAGAGTSTASFDCTGATGTNFRIANAPAFGPAPQATAAVPTLETWALVALAAILGAASLVVLRRRPSA